jgi:ribonuclease HII
MPDFAFEQQATGPVAGVDEAGRGPWAGPVVAAAVILDIRRISPDILGRIDDSKRLSRTERLSLFDLLRGKARIGLGASSAREIDVLNIHRATLLAMCRALTKLGPPPCLALVDGKFAPEAPCPVRTIIGGDGLSLSIAAASIVAKVTRDRIMARLACLYPGFGFERNAGYGTPEHRQALESLGPTPHHRKSFAPVLNILSRGDSAPLTI